MVSAFDRPGRQIAYSWFGGPSGESPRILSTEGDNPQPRTVYQNPQVDEIYPYDWTPDGLHVVVGLLRRQDGTAQIGLVSTNDGTLRVLKSTEWRVFGNMQLSPNGKFLAVDLPEILELYINPLIVKERGQGAVAADIRIGIGG